MTYRRTAPPAFSSRFLGSIAATSATLLVAGCATLMTPRATALLMPTAGNNTSGTVRFLQSGDKVQVSGEIRGLKPDAEHGFHVHEKGDCSSADGASAGGHFNPSGMPHGNHGVSMRHSGDLPALKAGAGGVATFSFESTGIAVGSGVNDIVGKALIVHRDADDYTTQPTGNSGPRLACAVIQKT